MEGNEYIFGQPKLPPEETDVALGIDETQEVAQTEREHLDLKISNIPKVEKAYFVMDTALQEFGGDFDLKYSDDGNNVIGVKISAGDLHLDFDLDLDGWPENIFIYPTVAESDTDEDRKRIFGIFMDFKKEIDKIMSDQIID
jgi:hypothetical protein